MRKTMLLCWVVLLAAGCVAAQNVAVSPASAPCDVGVLYEKAKAASLEILVGGRSEGSGWLADPNGLLITAEHVISGKNGPIEVRGPSIPERTVAKVVGLDCGHDLALLSIPSRAAPYPCLEVAPQSAKVGQRVFLFGTALFRHNEMLPGYAARNGNTYEFSAFCNDYVQCYHIAGASPPGTSGGCWIDEQGRVVANQSGYISLEKAPQGLCYVIPAEAIGNLLRERKTVVISGLGMAVDELNEQAHDFIDRFPAGQEGLVPMRLLKGGPAETAGLSRDTLIVAADGKSVSERDEFLTAIRAHKPGTEITLRVVEAGKAARDVKLRLRQVVAVPRASSLPAGKPASVPANKPVTAPASQPSSKPADRAAH